MSVAIFPRSSLSFCSLTATSSSSHWTVLLTLASNRLASGRLTVVFTINWRKYRVESELLSSYALAGCDCATRLTNRLLLFFAHKNSPTSTVGSVGSSQTNLCRPPVLFGFVPPQFLKWRFSFYEIICRDQSLEPGTTWNRTLALEGRGVWLLHRQTETAGLWGRG